jgi:hypothetical protein
MLPWFVFSPPFTLTLDYAPQPLQEDEISESSLWF